MYFINGHVSCSPHPTLTSLFSTFLGWLYPRIRQQLFIAEPSDLRGHCRQRRPPISPYCSSDWSFHSWCCCWEQCVQRSRVDGRDQWCHFCCSGRCWRQQWHGCVQYRRFYSPACVSIDCRWLFNFPVCSCVNDVSIHVSCLHQWICRFII